MYQGHFGLRFKKINLFVWLFFGKRHHVNVWEFKVESDTTVNTVEMCKNSIIVLSVIPQTVMCIYRDV